jgi:hypothetical protein
MTGSAEWDCHDAMRRARVLCKNTVVPVKAKPAKLCIGILGMGGLKPANFPLKCAVGPVWAATNAGFRGRTVVFAEKMANLSWRTARELG